jgi:hypothetical protein
VKTIHIRMAQNSPAGHYGTRNEKMKSLVLSKVYQLLEPGPVVLLTTAQAGRPNVMTLSWHMMVEFEPPRVACVVSDRDFSFHALRKTRECVIAVPGVDLAEKVVQIGNCHRPRGHCDRLRADPPQSLEQAFLRCLVAPRPARLLYSSACSS